MPYNGVNSAIPDANGMDGPPGTGRAERGGTLSRGPREARWRSVMWHKGNDLRVSRVQFTPSSQAGGYRARPARRPAPGARRPRVLGTSRKRP